MTCWTAPARKGRSPQVQLDALLLHVLFLAADEDGVELGDVNFMQVAAHRAAVTGKHLQLLLNDLGRSEPVDRVLGLFAG